MTGDGDYIVCVYSVADGFVVTYTYDGTEDDPTQLLSGGQSVWFDDGEDFGIAIPG